MEAQQQRVTIARVLETPKLLVKIRGKEFEAEQPCVGCVVACYDNGYSPAIGHRQSYVVTEVVRVKRTGVASQVLTHAIVALDETTVTFDAAQLGPCPRLFTSDGYAHWDDESSHNLTRYTWDEYVTTVEGDYNK